MELEQYLRLQAGLVTHAQALAAGLSGATVRRRVASGRWVRVHPRVYLCADRERTDEVRLRAAVLWAGDGAIAHSVSAAWWYGMHDRLPRPVQVTVPRRRRSLVAQPRVRVRRRDVDRLDQTVYRDVPVTGIALTAIEAAVALGRWGPAMLDRALQQRVDFGWVYRAHGRNLGRNGSAAAAGLLVVAADRAASHAERLFVRLLRDAGITGWELGHAWQDYVIDVAFPRLRIAVEVDGWAWHMTPERFVRDRTRQNAIVNGGWHVLRFTWHDLTDRPSAVVEDVRAALHLTFRTSRMQYAPPPSRWSRAAVGGGGDGE